MNITYSISQWNYFHYSSQASLERVIEAVRRQGYGFELWGSWGDETDLYDELGRKRLAGPLAGMAVSMHTRGGGARNFDNHVKQIDTAAHLGAKVVVLHPDDFAADPLNGPDADIIGRVVEYAQRKGVKLALENGPFEFLSAAFDICPALGFCLDVGHVYFHRQSMREHLEAFKGRLVHLHIQDIVAPEEAVIPSVFSDHYVPGTGGIPADDWRLVAETLREINYSGIAVFEIKPRNPLQTAFHGTRFFEGFLRS